MTSQNEWTVISPLFIAKNLKGDKWYFNLNYYRNTHYHLLNKLKINYKTLVEPKLRKLPNFNKVSITFNIYAGNERLFDIGNVGSIIEKFFLDALVECGKLEDDNYTFVPETHTYFKGIDKNNPRVEIIIKELMMEIKVVSRVDIKITQEDLENLVSDKIKAHDENINIRSIEFIQKRNPNRIEVQVDAQYGELTPELTPETDPDEAESEMEPESVSSIFE